MFLAFFNWHTFPEVIQIRLGIVAAGLFLQVGCSSCCQTASNH